MASKIVQVWEELKSEMVFEKYGRGVEKVTFRLPNGQINDYFLKKEKPTANAVAITKDKKVILTKQFRPGVREILLELPGGYIDQEESPLAAAERELLEETGYKGKAQFVNGVIDDAYSNAVRYCVVVTDCEKVADPINEDDEFIDLVFLTIEEFRAHLRSGKMGDVELGYLGLDYLGLL